MTDYISREAAVVAVCRRCNYAFPEDEPCGDCLAKTAIMAVPAADVEPVRHGRWTLMDGYVSRRACSICGWDVPEYGKFFAFCPNCGAKMDLEGEK